MQRFKTESWFSLIELLMVLAIFMILISLLNPSLKKLIESSNTAKCKTNLRTIHMGSVSWSEDNEGWIVPANWRSNRDLYETIGGNRDRTPQEYICPSFPDELPANSLSTYAANGYALLESNINFSPGDPVPGDPGYGWGKDYRFWSQHGKLKMHTIRNPAQVMFYMDLYYFIIRSFSHPFGKTTMPYTSRWHRAWFSPQVSNVVFFDGHVDFEPMDSDQNWRNYLYDPQ